MANPLDWAVTDVLLSPDLAPRIFASLTLKEEAAASVCTQWRDVWTATEHLRRGLRKPKRLNPNFTLPDLHTVQCVMAPNGQSLLLGRKTQVLEGTPNGGHQVRVVQGYVDIHVVRVVDPRMQTLQDLTLQDLTSMPPLDDWRFLAMSDDSVYVNARKYTYDPFSVSDSICRYDLASSVKVAMYVAHDDVHYIKAMIFAPNGTLFIAVVLKIYDDEDDGTRVERKQAVRLLALDGRTLEERFWFGRYTSDSIFTELSQDTSISIAASNDELYLSESKNRCIHVFSLSGEWLRKIGDWSVQNLAIVDDRLYLSEWRDRRDEEERATRRGSGHDQ